MREISHRFPSLFSLSLTLFLFSIFAAFPLFVPFLKIQRSGELSSPSWVRGGAQAAIRGF